LGSLADTSPIWNFSQESPPYFSLREICLYISSATELFTQRSSAFANIRRAEEEAVPKNRNILTDVLNELEYKTSGTIRTTADSTFNKKRH
jgi:hypothetical protein